MRKHPIPKALSAVYHLLPGFSRTPMAQNSQLCIGSNLGAVVTTHIFARAWGLETGGEEGPSQVPETAPLG